MNYFLETSALLKIYPDEPGFEIVQQVFDDASNLYVSELTQVEFVSSVSRKHREGRIDTSAHQALILRFAEDVRRKYQLLRFGPPVISEATRILRDEGLSYPIRSLDALQLAFFNHYCTEATVLVCADRHLVAVAKSNHLTVLNPEPAANA